MITHIRNIHHLLPRRTLSSGSIRLLTATPLRLSKTHSTTPLAKDGRNDEPIKFFGSGAASWRAKDTRSGGSDENLWYQPYVISASLAVFMLYFCVFREENDIDEKLQGSLFNHIEGLEEQQLVISYKYNKERGLNTTDIENRLLELGIDVRKLDQ